MGFSYHHLLNAAAESDGNMRVNHPLRKFTAATRSIPHPVGVADAATADGEDPFFYQKWLNIASHTQQSSDRAKRIARICSFLVVSNCCKTSVPYSNCPAHSLTSCSYADCVGLAWSR
jgi:hypothetical protein